MLLLYYNNAPLLVSHTVKHLDFLKDIFWGVSGWLWWLEISLGCCQYIGVHVVFFKGSCNFLQYLLRSFSLKEDDMLMSAF